MKQSAPVNHLDYYPAVRLMVASLSFSVATVMIALELKGTTDPFKIIIACSAGPILLTSALAVYMEPKHGKHNICYVLNRVMQGIVAGVIFRFSNDIPTAQQLIFLYLLVFATYIPRVAQILRLLVCVIALSAHHQNSQVYWVTGVTHIDALIEVLMFSCQWQAERTKSDFSDKPKKSKYEDRIGAIKVNQGKRDSRSSAIFGGQDLDRRSKDSRDSALYEDRILNAREVIFNVNVATGVKDHKSFSQPNHQITKSSLSLSRSVEDEILHGRVPEDDEQPGEEHDHLERRDKEVGLDREVGSADPARST